MYRESILENNHPERLPLHFSPNIPAYELAPYNKLYAGADAQLPVPAPDRIANADRPEVERSTFFRHLNNSYPLYDGGRYDVHEDDRILEPPIHERIHEPTNLLEPRFQQPPPYNLPEEGHHFQPLFYRSPSPVPAYGSQQRVEEELAREDGIRPRFTAPPRYFEDLVEQERPQDFRPENSRIPWEFLHERQPRPRENYEFMLPHHLRRSYHRPNFEQHLEEVPPPVFMRKRQTSPDEQQKFVDFQQEHFRNKSETFLPDSEPEEPNSPRLKEKEPSFKQLLSPLQDSKVKEEETNAQVEQQREWLPQTIQKFPFLINSTGVAAKNNMKSTVPQIYVTPTLSSTGEHYEEIVSPNFVVEEEPQRAPILQHPQPIPIFEQHPQPVPPFLQQLQRAPPILQQPQMAVQEAEQPPTTNFHDLKTIKRQMPNIEHLYDKHEVQALKRTALAENNTRETETDLPVEELFKQSTENPEEAKREVMSKGNVFSDTVAELKEAELVQNMEEEEEKQESLNNNGNKTPIEGVVTLPQTRLVVRTPDMLTSPLHLETSELKYPETTDEELPSYTENEVTEMPPPAPNHTTQLVAATPEIIDTLHERFARWLRSPNFIPTTIVGNIEPKEPPQNLFEQFEIELVQRKDEAWQLLARMKDLHPQLQAFAKFLLEQLLIDFELEYYRQRLAKRVSASELFRLFDTHSEHAITFEQYSEGIAALQIVCDLTWENRVFLRASKASSSESKMSFGDFVALISPSNGKMSNIWKFNFNYADEPQEKEFPADERDVKELLQAIFDKIAEIERSVLGLRQLLPESGSEAEFFDIFAALDTEKRGHLLAIDLANFLNEFGDETEDINEDQFSGILRRLSSCATQRVSFEDLYFELRERGDSVPYLREQKKSEKASYQLPKGFGNSSPISLPPKGDEEHVFPGFKKYNLEKKID